MSFSVLFYVLSTCSAVTGEAIELIAALSECVSVCVSVRGKNGKISIRCLSGGKRGDYQNCSVLYCVLKLCTVISTLR